MSLPWICKCGRKHAKLEYMDNCACHAIADTLNERTTMNKTKWGFVLVGGLLLALISIGITTETEGLLDLIGVAGFLVGLAMFFLGSVKFSRG